MSTIVQLNFVQFHGDAAMLLVSDFSVTAENTLYEKWSKIEAFHTTVVPLIQFINGNRLTVDNLTVPSHQINTGTRLTGAYINMHNNCIITLWWQIDSSTWLVHTCMVNRNDHSNKGWYVKEKHIIVPTIVQLNFVQFHGDAAMLPMSAFSVMDKNTLYAK